MTSSIIHFFLFLAVFIIYIHFHNQNSYPDNLDITLQKTCDLKKPFLFEYIGEPFLSQDSVLFTGSNHTDSHASTDADNVSVPFSQLSSFLSSTNNSSSSNYIETDNLLYNSFSPPSSTFAGYNVLCGSQDVCSKVFTHNYYRKFIYVETGSVEIYFLSHQQSISSKIISDYVNFEFSSDSNILSLASEKCTVQAGNIVYIPSNCLYCIVYKDKSNICIDMSYHSIISFLSNIHKIGLYYIQQSNILQTPSNIKKYEPSAPAVLEPDSPVDETIDTIVEDSSGNNTSS